MNQICGEVLTRERKRGEKTTSLPLGDNNIRITKQQPTRWNKINEKKGKISYTEAVQNYTQNSYKMSKFQGRRKVGKHWLLLILLKTKFVNQKM